MTLPPSLSELDAESEAEPTLSRVTLVVGDLRLDVGLPPNNSIAGFIDEVIDIANEQLAAHPGGDDLMFDTTEGKWTLARLGEDAIDPGRSLSEANIYDGELLVIREMDQPARPLLFDDIQEAPADEATHQHHAALGWLSRDARLITCFGVGLAATVTVAFLLPRRTAELYVPATALGIGVLAVIIACLIAYRSAGARRSEWLAAVATPLLFGGALYVVPDGFGAKSLPMAFGLTGLGSLLVLLITGRGRALHTAVISLAVIGGTAGVADLLWNPAPRAIGAVLATVSVIVVYLSPRVTILLAKLPVPRVPTAGEPLDDIETQGGTTVEGVNAVGKQVIPTEEGMTVRVRRASQYLTGILAAAAITATAGCYLALDFSSGFYWQGTVFVAAVATVLCLRGRSHHDLVQSATLVAAGMTIALLSIVKVTADLDGRQFYATLALGMLMVLIIACGVVAPRLEFSPVMRRQVEILEYLAIVLVFPLCFWIVRLYAVFRELRL
ncbi:type VII secretion integral membrane protein EccD [Mycobacterium paragordonae]|uniref:Type VII secretion integral membrane protein EccD n=1 Tax=Mycobacterium paragordonae TaxID=1389713 RepID=A0ABQ1C8J3_9MYCO|nr:type VII secretion integral membrane protein EccD [Mycobacterium paragordonae]AYE97028.1 type VII secretion integral membrane protein EccD [Mycobacterium paragordonae]GFG80611.1 type VII secretion integral membrane protein EccD [Mycobacterium paragordonae]